MQYPPILVTNDKQDTLFSDLLDETSSAENPKLNFEDLSFLHLFQGTNRQTGEVMAVKVRGWWISHGEVGPKGDPNKVPLWTPDQLKLSKKQIRCIWSSSKKEVPVCF